MYSVHPGSLVVHHAQSYVGSPFAYHVALFSQQRLPQSAQSDAQLQSEYSAPMPPSSQRRLLRASSLIATFCALEVFLSIIPAAKSATNLTAIVFNPKETADNLKRHGGFIPGIRPGERTAEYIDYVLTRITVVGAIYLVFVCILPEILVARTGVSLALGGTSLLIIVSVTLDTVSQIQGHLIAQQYEGLIKKSKLRGGKRGR